MGYGVIPIIASVLLAIHHVVATGASRWSKLAMVIIVSASLVVWQYYPRWLILATLMQVGAAIYMLLYSRFETGA